MIRSGSRVVAMTAGLACLLLLGGCFEEEKRPLIQYDHETYQGKKDQSLAPATVDSLRQRAAGQAQPF